MTDPARFLSEMLAPFVEIDEAALAALAAQLRPVRFAAGQVLYDQGVPCRDAVLLTEGIVRAYYLHEGREVNLRLIAAPAVATAMSSLITGQPSGEWVAAITEVRGFRARFAPLAKAGHALLVERIARVLAEEHYLSLERRLRMLQWKSVEERYAYFREHMDPVIVTQTPGYHVASYLGVAPETLSRVRGRALLDRSQGRRGARRRSSKA